MATGAAPIFHDHPVVALANGRDPGELQRALGQLWKRLDALGLRGEIGDARSPRRLRAPERAAPAEAPQGPPASG
jgi:hypothetical protein